eukprot:scaffold91544_cov54-Phaeocystis_antarctica.AAC.1
MPRQCRMSASSGSPKTTGICCDEMSRTSRRSRDAALVMARVGGAWRARFPERALPKRAVLAAAKPRTRSRLTHALVR